MNKIIENYDKFSLEDKYIQCTDRLLETENNLLKYDELILNEWYTIQDLNMFRDQRDYFDYMISLPNYENLMNIKKILEFEIIHLDTLYENYKEEKEDVEDIDIEIKPMQESISLHMEQLEH